MLCAPLDWQYAELPSSASDIQSCVLCSFIRCGTSNQIERKKRKKKNYVLGKHVSSSKDNEFLDHCPYRRDNWCLFQRDNVNKTNKYGVWFT